jgi:PucR family transcriptional regulator, purine catabolism regulatory protein
MTAADRTDGVQPDVHVHLLPTVAETLAFESLRKGRAEVVAGSGGTDRRVRWVHVSELPTIAEMLRGGELLLTTGIALPEKPEGLARYIRQLARADAAGVVIGLGPRFVDQVPMAMLRAADETGLPLILLRRFTRFIDITEDVHSQIVDIQVEELRVSERIHATFTELAMEGIGLEDVIHQVAKMAGCPIVLENLVHRVLAYDTAGHSPDEVIEDWESRSRSVRVSSRTAFDPASGWLVSSVGARGKDWGRLVLLSPQGPLKRMETLAERAAATLALGRLVERDAETLELQAHGTLLSGLLSPKQTIDALAVEAEAAGIPLENRRVVGAALRLTGPVPTDLVTGQVRLRNIAESATAAARSAELLALIGIVEDFTVAVLISLPLTKKEDPALDRWTKNLRYQSAAQQYVIGVGAAATRTADIRGSLMEATQVAAVAQYLDVDKPYFRRSDLGLRGLLQTLRGDVRLQGFAEGELGPLLEYDRVNGTGLVAVLRSFLESGRRKTAAAERAHVSRSWMYERLAKVEEILGVSLESEDTCVCLQVALMALDTMRT